jgi:excisionase family DNA binding protein
MTGGGRSKEIFSTHDAARICRVTPMTVIRWIKEGKIPAFKTAGGHRRILRADLIRFCKARAIPFALDEGEAGRVLIIDADSAVRDAVAEAVRSVDAKLTVEHAGDAFTAGRHVGEFRPNLIFLDQRLAGADALDLTARLAQNGSAQRVVVLVASSAGDAERAFRVRGALACIVKPPAPAAVARAVRAAFHIPDSAATLPTIHIVDPDARSARTLRRDLESRLPGCRVILFDSSVDALLTLPVERPDLLLFDVTDPDVNPTAFITRVAGHVGDAALAILALAPARAESLGAAAVAAGARASIQKPCNVEEVLAHLGPSDRAEGPRKRGVRR